MLVVDSSAVLSAVAVRRRDDALLDRLADEAQLHSPHLIDVEILTVLRRLVAGGDLAPDRAEHAREDFAGMRIRRYGHEVLADSIWALSVDLAAHDAAFVALAQALDAPLATCDAEFAAKSQNLVQVELYGGS